MVNKIAIAGGIACGKTTFLNLLGEKVGKENILSIDDIVTELYEFQEVKDYIVTLMMCYNSNITAFSKNNIKNLMHIPDFKREIEGYVHPMVKKEISKSNAFFLEHPLLFEIGQNKDYLQSWLIACDPEIQIQRLIKRNNYDEFTAKKWINFQIPMAEKILKADKVFFNNGSIEDLTHQIDEALIDVKRFF